MKCRTVPVEKDGRNITECIQNVPCRYTNDHSYETALLLSVFLGLLKFCTLGFFFVFHLVDVILIATQKTKVTLQQMLIQRLENNKRQTSLRNQRGY
nr:TM2 domain-containing protein CG10795-like [Pocillopora verrucosa]